jgi:tetrahydromethanopterin S-methyltransferase subunit G
MCSCGTKKSAHLINEVSKENVQTEWIRFEALKDTFSGLKIELDKSKLKIIETIKITEYDAESGKPIKETDAKREITQDSDQAIAESEQERIELSLMDSLNHFRESTKKVESEATEESIGFQDSFGKWFGIIFGCVVGLLVVYLLRKLRIN